MCGKCEEETVLRTGKRILRPSRVELANGHVLGQWNSTEVLLKLAPLFGLSVAQAKVKVIVDGGSLADKLHQHVHRLGVHLGHLVEDD